MMITGAVPPSGAYCGAPVGGKNLEEIHRKRESGGGGSDAGRGGGGGGGDGQPELLRLLLARLVS